MSNETILVTGISGYIGGQTALILKDQGYNVVGIDIAALPDHLQQFSNDFYCDDFYNIESLNLPFRYNISAVIHCAGTSLVGPSMLHPSEYYDNNVIKTKQFLDYLVSSNFQGRFIFSSSAAVYGDPIMTPCVESDPLMPISPYGESKLMVENILSSYLRAYNLNFVAFRYFNACGADSLSRHGQAPGATHIIARVLESIRDDKSFTLYGNDYPTADGTCVRDYVHVEDLARAHMLAIDPVLPAGIYNLGLNNGISNMEIIQAAQRITGQKVKIVSGPNRPGDPAELTASAAKFESVIKDWKHYTLDDMIHHAWAWYNR
jgi:UDP-glucose 4-epimerase